jgi:hypothetical protein
MPKYELHKVGFIDPTDLTDTVVLSTILEGSEGATRAFIEEEAERYVQEDDQSIVDGQVFTFTMAGKPTSDEAQLTTWANDGTKLTIVGYAYGEFLQIDNAIISLIDDLNERRVWKVSAKKAGRLGFDSSAKLDTEVMMSKNGLNMYYFDEGTTSGVLGGWSKTGGTTTFTGGVQTISTTGATVVYLQRDIYFPFEKLLTFFINVTALTDVTAPVITIAAYDEDSAIIGSATSQAISATGIVSVAKTLPSGTVFVRVRVGAAQNDSVGFDQAGLSIGTSTEYISQ